MAETTTTTVTTTTQTTTFFSLPLWRRRAAPSMSAAVSEGPQRSAVRARATEDGRIARAVSYNIDFNKDLPDVPRDADTVDPLFARRSTGTMHFPTCPLEAVPSSERTRPSRASTLMPPQSQSTYTLAQAGLGIGLSHVMPSVAGATPRGPSTSTSARPSTAPRPTRMDTSPVVRRVKSFSRSQTELATPQPKRKASSSQLQIVPSGDDSGVLADENPSSSSPSTRSESRSL
ncbi:uncharacterized protein FOMMEDRAFT_19429, partial [Fomitiporia mediterranea MF3/22]|uniref:uncharacterized protein n=1 Tax=Fomitiporia mediterranea (strain MF3/22) TaxID=694068 RepID=UPI000440903A